MSEQERRCPQCGRTDGEWLTLGGWSFHNCAPIPPEEAGKEIPPEPPAKAWACISREGLIFHPYLRDLVEPRDG